jgi:hypothetical protein
MNRLACLTSVLLFVVLVAPLLAAGPSDPAAGAPPTVQFTPGPEYADAVRMFQGIPGMERAASGRLWATWYGGGVTEDQHNYVMLVTSGDDGQTWSSLKAVLDPDRAGPVRAFDPCLWHDPQGRLWLFWAQRGQGLPQLLAMTTDNSGDENPTWSKPRWICEGIMMNKPTVLTDGRWLLPVAIWGREKSDMVVASADRGQSWQLVGAATVPVKKDRNCDEHMLVERHDGSLWMLVRTGYGIGESVSRDGGKTWSDVQRTTLCPTVSRFFIRRLRSGKLLLVKHAPPRGAGRSHLTAYLSDDDGKTWQGGLLLDERNGVSYPDGVEGPDGTIYVIYDFSRQDKKQIFMAAFTEEDIAQKKSVSSRVRLRVLVNQATGVGPKQPAANVTLSDNPDGQLLLAGPLAVVEAFEGQPRKLLPGSKLFLNRDYTLENIPSTLEGKSFVCASIDRLRVVCRREGVIYLLTPSPGRNLDSLAETLVKQGFQKAQVREFLLFGSTANICSVYQKRVAKDERIELGKWAVLVGATAD